MLAITAQDEDQDVYDYEMALGYLDTPRLVLLVQSQYQQCALCYQLMQAVQLESNLMTHGPNIGSIFSTLRSSLALFVTDLHIRVHLDPGLHELGIVPAAQLMSSFIGYVWWHRTLAPPLPPRTYADGILSAQYIHFISNCHPLEVG